MRDHFSSVCGQFAGGVVGGMGKLAMQFLHVADKLSISLSRPGHQNSDRAMAFIAEDPW